MFNCLHVNIKQSGKLSTMQPSLLIYSTFVLKTFVVETGVFKYKFCIFACDWVRDSEGERVQQS